MNEQALIKQAQQGNVKAFEALMAQHASFVYNLALRTLNNTQEAEDIAQEAFVRVWRALPKFRADAKFSTWLYRIVINLCYNRLPKLKRDLNDMEPDDTLEQFSDDSQRVESSVLGSELKQEMHKAIDKLPEQYKLLITLRHLQGMSYAEIVTVTGLPLGTVKTGIFRARRELRTALEAYRRNV